MSIPTPKESAQAPMPLTREQLLELERAPRTPRQVVLDYVICASPLLMGALALVEYLCIPNLKGNTSTETYVVFIGLLMAALGAAFIAAFVLDVNVIYIILATALVGVISALAARKRGGAK